MSESVAQSQLRSFVERAERLNGEKDAINADLSELFKEAKGEGFDTKVLKAIISDRAKDPTKKSEFDALYDLYAEALGMIVATRAPAHENSPVEHDADGVFPDDEPQSAPHAARDLTSPMAPAGQVAPIQPPVASDQSAEANTVDDGLAEPACAQDVDTANIKSAPDAGSSNGRTAPFDGVNAGSTPAPASTLSFADKIKKLRPMCQQPGACRSSGGKAHCYLCTKATEQAGAA